MNTATTTRKLDHDELTATLEAVRIPACPSIVADVMREAQRDEPSADSSRFHFCLARLIDAPDGRNAGGRLQRCQTSFAHCFD